MYSIPFKIIHLKEESYHIGFTGMINGKPCRMLIDTGASKSVLDRSFVDVLGESIILTDSEELSSGLGTNSMRIEVAEVDSLTMGDFSIHNWQVAVIDLSHVNQAYQEAGHEPIHMVLGNDILLPHHASINYETKLLFLN